MLGSIKTVIKIKKSKFKMKNYKRMKIYSSIFYSEFLGAPISTFLETSQRGCEEKFSMKDFVSIKTQ
jgi:hypothetical protein